MNTMKHTLLATLIALAAGTAQAAHVELGSGVFSSTWQSSATTAGDSLDFGGTADDLSAPGYLLGFGGESSAGAFGAGQYAYDSASLVAVDAISDPALAMFQASISTSIAFDSIGALNGYSTQSATSLTALFNIASDGEAAGSMVRVNIAGTVDAFFSSSVSGVPTSDALVFALNAYDASDLLLGSFSGTAGGSFDLAFNSAIGEQVKFVLEYSTLADLGTGLVGAGEIGEVGMSAIIDGTLSVSAVPEADSWAMLAAGLGLIGLVARRRRTHRAA